MVETSIAAMYVASLNGIGDIVVREAGALRQRPHSHQACSDCVESVAWNRIIGEALPDRGAARWIRGRRKRIIYPVRDDAAEIAAANLFHGHGYDLRVAKHFTIALVVCEEECSIPDNRPADARAVLIELERRLGCIRTRKEVARVEAFVAQELEERPVDLV